MFATTATARAGPFRLRDMSYQPGARQPRHAHDEFQISFLMRGRMEETTSSGTRVAVPGQVIVKAPGTFHANAFGPEGVRILCVDGDAQGDPYVLGALREAAYFPEHGGAVGIAAMDLLRAYRAGQALDDAVTDLVATLPSPARHLIDDCLARRAVRIIRDRFFETISLSDVAQQVGVHPTHLARQFRRTFGQSVGEYLRGCRLQHATHLIASTRLPLADIALQSGFADQPHLTRTLQRALGVTSRRFRLLVSA